MQRKTGIGKDNADDDNLAAVGTSHKKASHWRSVRIDAVTATETQLGSRHQVKCVDDESNATNLPSC